MSVVLQNNLGGSREESLKKNQTKKTHPTTPKTKQQKKSQQNPPRELKNPKFVFKYMLACVVGQLLNLQKENPKSQSSIPYL